jgi:hypothetical protein
MHYWKATQTLTVDAACVTVKQDTPVMFLSANFGNDPAEPNFEQTVTADCVWKYPCTC